MIRHYVTDPGVCPNCGDRLGVEQTGGFDPVTGEPYLRCMCGASWYGVRSYSEEARGEERDDD